MCNSTGHAIRNKKLTIFQLKCDSFLSYPCSCLAHLPCSFLICLFLHPDHKFRRIFVTCVSNSVPSSGHWVFKECIGTQIKPTVLQLKMPSLLLFVCWDSSEYYFCRMGGKLRAQIIFLLKSGEMVEDLGREDTEISLHDGKI